MFKNKILKILNYSRIYQLSSIDYPLLLLSIINGPNQTKTTITTTTTTATILFVTMFFFHHHHHHRLTQWLLSNCNQINSDRLLLIKIRIKWKWSRIDRFIDYVNERHYCGEREKKKQKIFSTISVVNK